MQNKNFFNMLFNRQSKVRNEKLVFNKTIVSTFIEEEIVKPDIDKANYFGVIGEIVEVVTQATEALGSGVALETMAMLSASIDPENISLSHGTHRTSIRINAMLVGKTGHGKGVSSKQMKAIYSNMDEHSSKQLCPIFEGGISSPEGIITQIRDTDEEPSNSNLPPSTGNKLLVIDEEISRIFALSKAASSTLSNTLRTLFDGSPLEPLTKYNRISCSKPHVVIYGHITPRELLNKVNEVDVFSGFLNRYPMYYAERKVLKPFPDKISDETIHDLSCKLVGILEWANEKSRELSYSTCYKELWESQYEKLSNLGQEDEIECALLGRAKHYATMYAMLFATIDKSDVIYVKHLEVALAWIDYWQKSVRYLFKTKNIEMKKQKKQERLDKVFEVIKREIDANGGLAIGKTPVTKAFSGKYAAKEITAIIHDLATLENAKINVTLLKRNAMEISLR